MSNPENKNIYEDFVKHIYKVREEIKYIEENAKCTCDKVYLAYDGCTCNKQVLISKKYDRIEEIMKSIDRFMQTKKIIIQKNN